jgi:biotin carboxyl carrier protein
VRSGEEIVAGDVVAVVEAMKMEMEIRSDVGGTIAEVLVTPGSPVPAGTPLVTLI